jgi:uncharacterized protein (DUF1778 family)
MEPAPSADRVGADPLRDTRLNIRATAAEKELIEAAARTTHQNASRFVMQAALSSAESVLADQTRFVLDDEAWDAFMRRLDEPARVVPALREAVERSDARRGR